MDPKDNQGNKSSDFKSEKHDSHEEGRNHFLNTVRSVFHVEDTRGIELLSSLHRVSRLSEVYDNQMTDEFEVSGPRWRMLLWLLVEEQRRSGGLTPTEISKVQRVSKNTISVLLRGLEEQGLIERSLDSNDLRVFRIQLTQAGRELLLRTGQKRIERLNGLLSAFTPAEIGQFEGLVSKLVQVLHEQVARGVCEEKTEIE